MAKKAYILFISVILPLLVTSEGLTSETGTLEVAVFKEIDNQPLKDAQVSFLNTNTVETVVVETDEKGIARIDCIPGDYLMTNVSKNGYTPHDNDIQMIAEKGKVNHIDIYLDIAPNITGFVHDKTGKGIEGASVRLVPEGPPEMVTDALGKFELRLAPRPIQLFFVARHVKQNLAGSIQFRSGIGGNEEYYSKDMNVEVEVSPGVTLTGKIVDPNQKIIPGIWVEAEIQTGRGDTPIAKVQVDENGKYSINALPIGHRYFIRATLDGYGVAFKSLGEISIHQDSINVDTLVLYEANQSIAGTVVDANGNGIENVQVICHSEIQPERETKTDSEGNFIIRNVCKGPLRIAVLKGYIVINITAESGVKDLKIILKSEPKIYTASAPIVKEAPPLRLVGKSLPQLDEIDIPLKDSQLKQKNILFCFFDIEQRPSRNCILELGKKVQELKSKDIEIITIHTSKIEQEYLDKWFEEYNIPFPVKIIKKDEEQTHKNWGIQALPWLILTNTEHIVIDEGFSIDQLDEKIKTLNK
ncbi:MAG: carboxypeptidase regulatory-like domain-containing protein [Sedimentisphaerales bacterium]|nr:carboxypeptidase regulatory-like domain-containing protein [Sedimentisphaerales bacterium]